VKGRSAIPEGRYAVVISWSPKFEQWLPILLGGPEFNRKWQGRLADHQVNSLILGWHSTSSAGPVQNHHN